MFTVIKAALGKLKSVVFSRTPLIAVLFHRLCWALVSAHLI